MADKLFHDLIGCTVKVPYRDGKQFKVARGVLEAADNGFVKITGKLGTIIINIKNIERIAKLDSEAGGN